jgi:hypothetical protein
LRKIEAPAPGGAHRRRRVTAQFGRNPVWSRASRSLTVNRGIEGEEVREEARCMGPDEMKGRKEGRATADAFYGGSVAQAQRKGGRGSRVGAAWRAGTGKRVGAPGVVGIAQVAGISPR